MGLQNRIDPPRSFTPEQAQQWYKLMEAIEAELGEAGLSNTLFVDLVEGDNNTAQRGSLVFKYETIQGALDAAQAGDTIFVSPGTYTENLTWPDINGCSLKGSGTRTTIVTNDGVSDTVTIAPTVELARADIKDIFIGQTGAADAISVDGTADADMFAQGFVMQNVVATGKTSMQTVNDYRFDNLDTSDLDVIDCGDGAVTNSALGDLLVRYNAAPATAPTSGRGVLRADGGTDCSDLTVDALGAVEFSKDTSIGSVTATVLDNATPINGYVVAHGLIGGAVDIDFTLTNADAQVADLSYCNIDGALDVADAGTSTQTASVNGRFCNLGSGVAQTNIAGDGCEMDLRHAQFVQDSLAVSGTGAIDRSSWKQIIPAGNADSAVAWADSSANAIPFVTGPEHVSVECANVLELPVGITAKDQDDVTYTKAGADLANVDVCAFKA